MLDPWLARGSQHTARARLGQREDLPQSWPPGLDLCCGPQSHGLRPPGLPSPKLCSQFSSPSGGMGWEGGSVEAAWGGGPPHPHPGVTSQVCSLRRAGDALDQAPGLPEAGGGGSEPEPNPQGQEGAEGRSRGWGRPRWARGLSPHTGGWWGGGSVPCPSPGWPSLALGAWGGGCPRSAARERVPSPGSQAGQAPSRVGKEKGGPRALTQPPLGRGWGPRAARVGPRGWGLLGSP